MGVLIIGFPLKAESAREGLAEVNFSTGGLFLSSDVSSRNSFINRVDISLWLSHNLSFELTYAKTFSEVNSSSPGVSIYSAGAAYVFGTSKRFLPYLKVGFGRGDFDTDKLTDEFSVFETGSGIKYLLGKDIGLKFDVRDYVTTKDGYHNLTVTLGFTYMFGTRPAPKAHKVKVTKQTETVKPTYVITTSEPEEQAQYGEDEMLEAEELGVEIPEPAKEDVVPAPYWREIVKKEQLAKKETVAPPPPPQPVIEKKPPPVVAKQEKVQSMEKEVVEQPSVTEQEKAAHGSAVETPTEVSKPAPAPVPEVLKFPVIVMPKKEEIKTIKPEKNEPIPEEIIIKEETSPAVKPLYGLILSVRQYYFELNSPYPDPHTLKKIDEFIETLKDKDIRKIIIEGFACAHGPGWFNFYLSKKRALVVKNYLQRKLSLPEDIFEIKFYGEGMLEVPELPADAPESLHARLNRRVVIKVFYKIK